MARESGQKFIRRNRPPRVHITYENPANAEEKVEIPFVMGVMADLSGNTPGVEKEEIGNRKFLDFDMDNLDARMAAIQPGVSFRVENKLSDNAGEKDGRQPALQQDGGFRAGGGRASGAGGGEAARGATAACQSACATWTARSRLKISLRKLLSDPQLMAALKNRAVTERRRG